MLVLLAAAGCGGGAGPVNVALPRPAPDQTVTARCASLHRVLPASVDGRSRRSVEPESPLTAAWGEPPVVLRCGVAKPRRLSATSEIIGVDHIDWFLDRGRAAYVFTTFGRRAYVEVRVPSSTPREDATAPLVDLAKAVGRTLPLR